MFLCNRKKRHELEDYPCNTFTFAKQYDYELPSTDNSASGFVRYMDKNTLPVRRETPDVTESIPGRRLNFEDNGSHFGPEKSYHEAMRLESETVEVAYRRFHSQNHCSCQQIAATASHKGDTSPVMSNELGLPLSPPGDRVMSNFTLTDEICLQIVDEAFRDIECMP